MSITTTQPTNPINRVSRTLARSATRARALLIVRAGAWIGSFFGGSLTIVILCDYLLRLPLAIRTVVFVALLILAWRLISRFLVPAIRARFTPVNLALRLQMHNENPDGFLASAVDLQTTHPGNAIESALREAALTRANARVTQPRSILRWRSTIEALVVLALMCIGAALIAINAPTLTRIGLQRTLTPWSGVSWPKRFMIADLTNTNPHAIDESLPIQISVSPSLSDARAEIIWTILDSNNAPVGGTTRSMLAAQPTREDQDGRVYEHLLDTRAFADRDGSEFFTLEYRIETRDDRTSKARITLARPPELVETLIRITPPAYAIDASPRMKLAPPRLVTQENQIVSLPALAGSQTSVTWVFSKPVVLETGLPAWARDLESRAANIALSQPNEQTIEFRMIAEESIVLVPEVRDRLSIPVRDPIAIDLPAHPDAPPSVVVLNPDRDTMITAHAMIDIGAQFADDIGLHSAWVSVTPARINGDSDGDVPEPDKPSIILRRDLPASGAPTILTPERVTLDVSEFEVSPGDEIWVNAHAIDLLGASNDRDPTDSETRILRIVDDQTMIEHIQGSLIPMQAALQRLDESQSTLQEQLHNDQIEGSRQQRSLSEQIRAQRQLATRLSAIARQNTLDDSGLQSLLDDAGVLLDDASSSAANAADAIEQNRKARAQTEQQLVRDRLGELIAQLDRGQDAWLARRSVQQLRDEIQRINDETTQLGATSTGKSLAQLSVEERTTLEKILDRQQNAADRAREMLDELDARAEQLQKTDPTQAEALRNAAAQGRGSQIEQTLKQAGNELAGNQTSDASESQQSAMDELDMMLEEIDHAVKNRDSALRRELASIIAQLQTLIETQQTHLIELQQKDADLDRSLIKLVENTLAVRDSAVGAFPETKSIAERINGAADAQSLAVNALRATPIGYTIATQNEQNALNHLEQALADAQRLDQQAADRESRRLRNELKAKYRDALDTQVSLRDATIPYIAQALTRKQRSETRALARAQDDLRGILDSLIAETQGLAEASVFALAHAQIDRIMARVVRSMNARTPPGSITLDHASAIHLLDALVEVLEDAKPQEQEFENGQESSGGSSNGESEQEQPLIPPIAQIKLLRSIQQLAAIQTRSMNESAIAPSDDELRALVELQQEIAVQGMELIEALNPQPEPHDDTQDPQSGPAEVSP